MQNTERYKPLSQYENKRVKLLLHVHSYQHEFEVDSTSLSRLARFFGFAEIRLLPIELLSSTVKKGSEVISLVREIGDEDDKPPLKAQWHSIHIFFDINLIKKKLPTAYTDSQLADRLEYLLKKELVTQGTNILKEVDYDLLALDLALVLIIWSTILAVHKYQGADITVNVEGYSFVLAAFIKIIASNLDSLTRFNSTPHQARMASLEGTQKERLGIKGILLKFHKIIYLREKPTNLR